MNHQKTYLLEVTPKTINKIMSEILSYLKVTLKVVGFMLHAFSIQAVCIKSECYKHYDNKCCKLQA